HARPGVRLVPPPPDGEAGRRSIRGTSVSGRVSPGGRRPDESPTPRARARGVRRRGLGDLVPLARAPRSDRREAGAGVPSLLSGSIDRGGRATGARRYIGDRMPDGYPEHDRGGPFAPERRLVRVLAGSGGLRSLGGECYRPPHCVMYAIT